MARRSLLAHLLKLQGHHAALAFQKKLNEVPELYGFQSQPGVDAPLAPVAPVVRLM